MKKVLIIANYTKLVGGISGQVEILLEKFNNKSVNTTLFNTKSSNIKRFFMPIKLYFISKDFDIFHVHGCSGLGFFPILIGVIIGKISNKKIIITYHGGGLENFINSYPKLIKYFLTQANTLTVPSIYLFDILKKNSINAVHLPNVIREDNVFFKEREKIHPKLIVTRSLEKVYNISLVIKAFEKIKKKFNEITLLIVGDGPLKSDLQKYIADNEIKDVVFTGRVKNSEIGTMLNKADIYINPTTADNMPLSLFEAFACGLPVISTNVGGLPNFITNNENGFLINSNDVNSLIDKIEYILLNQENIRIIISNAYLTFEMYTWVNLKRDYYQLYN